MSDVCFMVWGVRVCVCTVVCVMSDVCFVVWCVCVCGMWSQSLRWEDPLEKEMANHSSILAWKIPWTEQPREL